MGLFDFFNKKKKERERQEQMRLQQEAKRKAEEAQRQAEARRQEELKRQEQVKLQDDLLSNFDFDSNCHQRFEQGSPVMGLQVCPRFIKIRKNINGCSGYQLKNGDGYILTATNGDTGKPQFAPKPMRVVAFTDSEILLKGYTVSAQTPFGWQEIDLSDYGFSIKLKNGKPDKCILHMYDRNTMLEYMIQDVQSEAPKSRIKEMTETEKFVVEAIQQLQMGNDGDATYHPLYKAWRSYRNNPDQLKDIQDLGRYGMGLMIFLSYGTVSDIDDRQQIASLSYMFLSKAIKRNPNINYYKNRLILMITNHEAFEYTVSSVVNKDQDWYMMSLTPFEARDAMFKMEFADLSSNSALRNIDMLNSKFNDLRNKISSNFFGPNKSEQLIISEGEKLHDDILDYIENKVLIEGDIDF